MNVYYFVQFADADLNQCSWLRFNERTPAGSLSEGSFEDALAAAAGQHLVVFAPSTAVSLETIELKAKSHKQLMAAIPYMLEEEMSEDVEELHFAINSIDQKKGVHLAGVVSRELIGRLHTAITAHSFLSAAVVPQTLSIPFASGAWSLLMQDDTATLRTGEHQGYGVDAINLDEILSAETAAFRQQHDMEVELVEYDLRTAADDPQGQNGAQRSPDTEVLALIGRYWLDHQDMLNLLQGSYQVKTGMRATQRLWMIAASLMAVSLLLLLSNTLISNQRLSAQSRQLEAAMHAIYTETFQDEARGEPAAAMRRQLLALQGSRGGSVAPFMRFVAASSRKILADKQSRVVRMSYHNKRMEIDIETTDFEKLEALQQQIASEAIVVDLKAVTSNQGKIKGRLVLAEVNG